MYAKTSEKARATAGTAMARSQNHQTQEYENPAQVSRRKLLEQAADVLLLLEFPLAEIERVAFDCLFERRLRRAYAEGDQC